MPVCYSILLTSGSLEVAKNGVGDDLLQCADADGELVPICRACFSAAAAAAAKTDQQTNLHCLKLSNVQKKSKCSTTVTLLLLQQ